MSHQPWWGIRTSIATGLAYLLIPLSKGILQFFYYS
jgi:hypothetical protein